MTGTGMDVGDMASLERTFVQLILIQPLIPISTPICKMTYPSIFSPLSSRKSLKFVDDPAEISTATPLEWKARLLVLEMGLDVIKSGD